MAGGVKTVGRAAARLGYRATATAAGVVRATALAMCIAGLLLPFPAVPVFASEPDDQQEPGPLAEDELPEESDEALTIGVAEFSVSGVPDDFRYLARSVPLRLLEMLDDVPERVRDEEELLGAAEGLLESRAQDLSSEVADAVTERDELLFSESGDSLRERRAELSETLSQLRRELASVRATNSDVLAERLSARRSVDMVRRDEQRSLYDSGSAAEVAEDSELDLLLGGALEWEDGYVLLSVTLYRASDDRLETLVQTLVRPEDVSDELDALRPQLVEALLGRPFGELRVETSEETASITRDGEIVGFGAADLRYLEPGEHTIRAAAAGFEDAEETVTVRASDRRRLSLELRERDAEAVTVDSDPRGADLYVGGEWRGQTPVTIDRPVGPLGAELHLEDYHDSRFVLEDRGDSQISRTLAPENIDLSQELRDRRAGFYRSLGWFAVSIPVPLILSGVWQNRADYYLANFDSMTPEQANSFLRDTAIVDGLRWGGVAVSGGLLINSVVQAVRYIRASQYYHFD